MPPDDVESIITRWENSGAEDSRRPVIAATFHTRLVGLNRERAAEEKRCHGGDQTHGQLHRVP